MGSGPDAVLDPRLRVRGAANLRVADASIMPTVLSANLNCSSMMIGHHAVSAGPVGDLYNIISHRTFTDLRYSIHRSKIFSCCDDVAGCAQAVMMLEELALEESVPQAADARL